jgi:hypothetical protein
MRVNPQGWHYTPEWAMTAMQALDLTRSASCEISKEAL